MRASVIISTYNSPDWLEKVLWGYSVQTVSDFEIIIADDGSNYKTSDLIKVMQSETDLKIKHVWHEDRGFQKCEILNKAIVATETDYLIFTDGDCIPRQDFVKTHVHNRQNDYFLSGGHFPLSMKISQLITKVDILNQKCFDLKWLKSKGLKSSFKNLKLTKTGVISRLINTVTSTKPTWNGGNASGWKKDILALNGFDERMQYGGQDREFGERLVNYGIKPKQIRYFAIVVHLEHSRGYKTPESISKNKTIRKETVSNKIVWTPHGIVKSQQPVSDSVEVIN